MDAEIIKKDGTSFRFEEYNISVKDFLVSSIPLETQYGQVEGNDGRVDLGASYRARSITIPFALKAPSLIAYSLHRDLLFKLINSREPFYIRELRRAKRMSYAFVDTNESARMDSTSDNQYVGGKRYMVRLQSTFDLEQFDVYGEGELVFETVEMPFAESIGKTRDIDENGLNYNDALWSYGMGLNYEDAAQLYSHQGTSFSIFNASDISIHPYEHDLKIEISEVVGSTEFLEIKNTTNNSMFKVNEAVGNELTIVIDGPNVTSGGSQYYRKTNKRFITLEPGWNHFTVSGASSIKILFDFRFYYL